MNDEEELTVTEHDEEQLTNLAEVHAALLGGDLTLEADPAAIARRIVEDIINAPDVEHAFKDRPVWHAQESIGMPFLLRGVRWYPSSLGEGAKVFAAVDAVNASSGEVGILTTSAYKQLAKLYVLVRDQGFPIAVRVSSSQRPTAGGYYPLDFELVEEETS